MSKKVVINKVKKPVYKRVSFWAVAALAVIIIAGASGVGSSDDKDSSTKDKVAQTTKKTDDKKADNKKTATKSVAKPKVEKKVASKPVAKTPANPKVDKMAAINASIAKHLKQDQGWSDGTLDSNGNPTNNGTSNSAFDWSKFIYKITVDKDNGDYQVTVIPSQAYTALNDSAKQEAILKSQNVAVSELSDAGKLSTDETIQGLYTNVYSGNKASLGHSKMTNYKEFKLY